MPEIKLYDVTEKYAPGLKRKIAVEAALELIRANGTGSSGSDLLGNHISQLSAYADLIQEALEVKKD
jgi:hypothetical protein